MPALSRDPEVHEGGRGRRRAPDTGEGGREWRRWNGDAAGPTEGDERESRGRGSFSHIDHTTLPRYTPLETPEPTGTLAPLSQPPLVGATGSSSPRVVRGQRRAEAEIY